MLLHFQQSLIAAASSFLALVFACWDLSVINKGAIVWWLVQQFTVVLSKCAVLHYAPDEY